MVLCVDAWRVLDSRTAVVGSRGTDSVAAITPVVHHEVPIVPVAQHVYLASDLYKNRVRMCVCERVRENVYLASDLYKNRVRMCVCELVRENVYLASDLYKNRVRMCVCERVRENVYLASDLYKNRVRMCVCERVRENVYLASDLYKNRVGMCVCVRVREACDGPVKWCVWGGGRGGGHVVNARRMIKACSRVRDSHQSRAKRLP
jgi:hypothetical protein